MPIDAVVADANVLLSAVTGRAALRVFTEFDVSVHATEFNVDEVMEYLPTMAVRYRLAPELLALQWRLLPLHVHPVTDYAPLLDQAVAKLQGRDVEDAHALALACRLGVPLWSNDRDLADRGVVCLPTARLLALLDGSPPPSG